MLKQHLPRGPNDPDSSDSKDGQIHYRICHVTTSVTISQVRKRTDSRLNPPRDHDGHDLTGTSGYGRIRTRIRHVILITTIQSC